MSSEAQRFFSDPKVALSVFAIFISAFSLFWTLANQWEQNRRWDMLNVGRVELTDVGFIIWKELSKEEALVTNWGYNPTLYSVVQDRVHRGKYQLPYELVLMTLDGSRIPHSNGFFTLLEAEDEAKRLHLQGNPPIYKHYQVQLDFRNTGSTTSKETTIKVTARLPDSQEPAVVFNSVEPVDVLPSSSINAAANIFVPLDVAFPHPLRFQILLGYKDVHGRAASREIPVIYDESQNYWTHGH